MAGRGRGAGRGMSFNIETLGFGRGESLPGPLLQPPPVFPMYPKRVGDMSEDQAERRRQQKRLSHVTCQARLQAMKSGELVIKLPHRFVYSPKLQPRVRLTRIDMEKSGRKNMVTARGTRSPDKDPDTDQAVVINDEKEPFGAVHTDQAVIIEDGPEEAAPNKTCHDKSVQTKAAPNKTCHDKSVQTNLNEQTSTSTQTDSIRAVKDVSVQTDPIEDTSPIPVPQHLDSVCENSVNGLDEVIAILDQLLLMYP